MPIASWASRGNRWGASLHRVTGGYRIEETKYGNLCGVAFRPIRMIPDDTSALAWAEQHVKDCFDVPMIRRS